MFLPRGMTRISNILVFLFVLLCLLLTSYNVWELSQLKKEQLVRNSQSAQEGEKSNRRQQGDIQQTYSVFAKHPDSGYLKHVFNVLERAGYTRVNYNQSSDWDVMWAHDYPFKRIREKMLSLRPGQRVNKFPGSGYITNKVNLATSGLDNVPPAFSIPDEKDKLVKYAASNPDKMFVQKSNNHRGIQIEKISDLDLDSEGSFVQEFIHNPLLVDGYKFDVGIYTTLTSVDPLRVYVHHTDVLLRFCPEKYHPFDPANKDKYVVQDDYLPSWKVPSFTKYMDEKVGFSFKDTLNAYVREKFDRDPDEMWQKMYETIVQVYRSQEEHFVRAVNHYPHKEAFFEMVRFDFVIDDQLEVFLMEANMSPNLSSAHFAVNALLYEQVVHSVLRLVGVVGQSVVRDLLHPRSLKEKEQEVSEKDLLVSPETCSSTTCRDGVTSEICGKRECELCRTCLSQEELDSMRSAWLERANQFSTRRVFPPPMSRTSRVREDLEGNNRKMSAWYIAKCHMDVSWCDL